MSSDSQLSNPPTWDWPSWMKGSMPNPLDVFAAPRNLVQPILPGWVFGSVTNVTEQNSSAPDTEQEIVAAQSYGRQLGRVMDALAVLIADLPKAKQDARAFKEFAKIRSEIDDIKAQAAARRLDRIAADLATLKETKPEEYERLAATLREAIKGCIIRSSAPVLAGHERQKEFLCAATMSGPGMPHYGLKSDVAPCTKSADFVAELPKCRSINFPQMDQTSRNRRSM
jgi:hypothetical protein